MHIPEWLPGAGFKTAARLIGEQKNQIETVPLAWTKERLAEGNYTESFASKYLVAEDGSVTADSELEENVKWCAGALYLGGGETVSLSCDQKFQMSD